jgi:hypothetical protein
MRERKSTKRKAWVVAYDEPRPPFRGQRFCGVEPGEPLAVFDSRLAPARLLLVVDAFVQNFFGYPSDMTDYVRRAAPYAAKVEGWGQQVIGGFNPYVEAFRVDDLCVVTDTDTGEERFEYTRRPLTTPRLN